MQCVKIVELMTLKPLNDTCFQLSSRSFYCSTCLIKYWQSERNLIPFFSTCAPTTFAGISLVIRNVRNWHHEQTIYCYWLGRDSRRVGRLQRMTKSLSSAHDHNLHLFKFVHQQHWPEFPVRNVRKLTSWV